MDCSLLIESFRFWSISHVRRDGNKAAHKLAKLAICLYPILVTMCGLICVLKKFGAFPVLIFDLYGKYFP
jgi:hypothetical protein